MIHLLQTGDLHLGKFFYGTSLIEDQKTVLKQLIKTVSEAKKQNPYHAVIITGDIYDRSIPPTEAIEVFDEFLFELHQIDKNLKILIISGNHDSNTRLSFGTKFFEKQNIFFCTNPEDCTKPVIIEGSDFDKNSQDVIYFYQLPFLTSGSLFNAEKNERLTTQNDLITEAIKRITTHHFENETTKNFPLGLNAHLFTLGSVASDSERVFIGNAELVDKKVFEDFSYVALGHLHKKQKVSDKIFYAGSPLTYSFDEANSQKSFLDIQIDFSKKTSLDIEEIEILPLHKVTKLTGPFEDFFRCTKDEDNEIFKSKNDFLEITCTDEILIENPVARLREIFPNILSIKQEAISKQQEKSSSTEKKELLNKSENIDSEKIFEEFLIDVENPENIIEWESTKNLFCKTAKSLLEGN